MRTPTRDTLNGIMEFDHVIRVHVDGSVTDAPEHFAPELNDGEVSPGWRLLDGYSGQFRYSGPIMHPSEFIGGVMADDILASPGVYVALTDTPTGCGDEDCDGQCENCDSDDYGWAVARLCD